MANMIGRHVGSKERASDSWEELSAVVYLHRAMASPQTDMPLEPTTIL